MFKLRALKNSFKQLQGISPYGEVVDFNLFFTYLNSKFQRVSKRDILNEADTAKGITFNVIKHKIVQNEALEFAPNGEDVVNALMLTPTHFDETWKHGIILPQNFGFTIYFNRDDLKGDKKNINLGYTKDYIEQIATQSPVETRKRLEMSKRRVRLRGFLNIEDIKFIGFRVPNLHKEDDDEPNFLFNFYRLNI